MKDIIDKIKADPRYQRNIEYGDPRSGHPEGKVKFHIADLEANLELLSEKGIDPGQYWKLKFVIHVHDSFKAETEKNDSLSYPDHHAIIAREYASQYTADVDLLNMIQYHDENYRLWREYVQTGNFNMERFQNLLSTIVNWDLFLLFIIIDGCTKGKDYDKLIWFINEVKKYKKTIVDVSWILPPG